MTQWLFLLGASLAGILLGLIFFQGLWRTIKRLPATSRPALWMLGSLMLRFGLTLGLFYLLARYGGWQPVLAAALGFTLARFVIVHGAVPHSPGKESDR
jgi:F1F0 ATPase subunit 2